MGTKTIELDAMQHASRISPDKYWQDEDKWDQGGSFSYRFDRDPNGMWIMPDYTSGSDYSSSSLVEVSNYRILLEECDKLAAEQPDTPAFHISFYGGYGTFALAFHIERTPESIKEQLAGLDNYPLIDEDDHSQLEMEKTEEAWENWARSDFKRELAKKFGDEATEDLEDPKLLEIFETAREKANEYWENKSADSMYIRLERIAAAVETLD